MAKPNIGAGIAKAKMQLGKDKQAAQKKLGKALSAAKAGRAKNAMAGFAGAGFGAALKGKLAKAGIGMSKHGAAVGKNKKDLKKAAGIHSKLQAKTGGAGGIGALHAFTA